MQSIRDQLLSYAVTVRNDILTKCENGETDTDLEPEHKPTRAEVSPNCLIKPFDELEISGSMSVLYLCPGRTIGWMHVLRIDGNAIPVEQYDVASVTDRIPADPNEAPMPIFPE